MIYNDLSPELLKQVSPVDLRTYARGRGWHRVEGDTGPFALFNAPEGRTEQLLVPIDPKFEDYTDRVFDAIRTLALRENRSLHQLFLDIMRHDSDILRFRISNEETESGSVSLNSVASLIDGVRRSLLAAAHSVITPQRFHPRLGRRDADQLLRACQMEQTERGSFVITISCPLRAVDAPEEGVFGIHDSFTRSTTHYLIKSLKLLASAIHGDRPDIVLQDNADQPVVSANLCYALLQLRPPANDGVLETSVSWAPSLPAPDADVATNQPSAQFLSDEFDAIEDIYLQLRPPTEPEQSVFPALVDQLSGYLNDQNEREGEVTLSIFSNEAGMVTARATLTAAQYRIADEAHMRGQLVLTRGLLQHGIRVARLRDITLFQALTAPE